MKFSNTSYLPRPTKKSLATHWLKTPDLNEKVQEFAFTLRALRYIERGIISNEGSLCKNFVVGCFLRKIYIRILIDIVRL